MAILGLQIESAYARWFVYTGHVFVHGKAQ